MQENRNHARIAAQQAPATARPYRRLVAALVVLAALAFALVAPVGMRGADAIANRALADPASAEAAPAELVLSTPRRGEARAAATSPDARGAPRSDGAGPDTLRGMLVRPDGGPTGGGHVVALLALDAQGAPVVDGAQLADGGRVVVAPGQGGSFSLELPAWAYDGPVLLVGRAPRLRPAGRTLRLTRGAPHDEVTLTLSDGASLHGRLTYGGEPLVGWPVELDLRFGVPGVSGAGEEAFWLAGQFVEKHARATTDSRGRFAFQGLVADRYDLRCSRPSPAIPATHTQVVEVDGAPLELELGSAELHVQVLGAGGVLEQVEVHASCDAGEQRFRAGRHMTVLAAPPHTEVLVRAEHATHEAIEARFTTGASGTRSTAQVTMRPAVRPALRVRLPGATAAALEQVTLDLLPLLGASTERRLQLRRGAGRDEFWLDVLPADPGPHSLRLASALDFRSEVLELDVPRSGVAEVTFRGERGGRYQVELESALPEWTATWRVLDATGQQVGPAVHRTVWPQGEVFQWGEPPSSERVLRPSHDVVPAGTYRLEVESDLHQGVSRAFEVAVGATTDVAVVLQPK